MSKDSQSSIDILSDEEQPLPNRPQNIEAILSAASEAGYNGDFVFNRLLYGSYLSEKYKLFYVETPKSACTSIKHMFTVIENKPYDPTQQKPYFRETKMSMFIHQRKHIRIPTLLSASENIFTEIFNGDTSWHRFAVSRNPYSRIVSFFYNKIITNEPGYNELYSQFGAANSNRELLDKFEAFVFDVAEKFDAYCDNPHINLQTTLLMKNIIKYDRVYKFEEMSPLREIISERTGITNFRIPNINKSTSGDWNLMFNERTAAVVKELYKSDFANFDYDPDGVEIHTQHQKLNNLPYERDRQMIEEIIARNETISYLYKYVM